MAQLYDALAIAGVIVAIIAYAIRGANKLMNDPVEREVRRKHGVGNSILDQGPK